LLQTEFSPQITGSVLYCPNETVLEVITDSFLLAVWNTVDTTFNLELDSAGTYSATITNQQGCRNISNALDVFADTIAPLGNPPQSLVVSCIDELPTPDPNLVNNLTDNCSAISVFHLADSLQGMGCETFVNRTYRLIDLSGNTTDLIQQIYIMDDVPPFGLAPSPVTVSCVDLLPDIDVNAVTNLSDNCSTVEVFHLQDVFGTDSCPQTVTRTYRLFDACGNFFDANQIITILDTIPPYGSVLDTTLVPCLAAFPVPDANVVQNFGDNCLFESISFLNDFVDVNDPNLIYRTFMLSDACGNIAEVVQVLELTNIFPAPSLVSFDGQFLTASVNLNYQWYLNGELLPGAIESSFIPANGGNYSVAVVDSFGCQAMSANFFVSLVGINQVFENEVFVYPNPTSGSLMFQFVGQELYIQLTDLAGNLIMERVIATNDSLDLSVLASGIYFVNFGAGSAIKPIKIVKN
jgi:hypothetical protein